jgi:hypothetical protein
MGAMFEVVPVAEGLDARLRRKIVEYHTGSGTVLYDGVTGLEGRVKLGDISRRSFNFLYMIRRQNSGCRGTSRQASATTLTT